MQLGAFGRSIFIKYKNDQNSYYAALPECV